MNRNTVLLVATFLSAAVPAPAAEDPAKLAAAAKAVLEKNCARCHANGQTEGGFGFVLDAKQLVEKKRVVERDSAKSRLFKKVQAGEMPPEDEKPRPTPEEIAALKAWIDAGAPDFTAAVAVQRGFLPETNDLAVVRDHLRSLSVEDQTFQRYFTLTHLYNNASVSDEDMRWQRAA